MNDQQNIIDKILKSAQLIHERSLLGSANYIIVSPQIAEIIDNLDIRKHRRKKLKKLQQIFDNENKKAS